MARWQCGFMHGGIRQRLKDVVSTSNGGQDLNSEMSINLKVHTLRSSARMLRISERKDRCTMKSEDRPSAADSIEVWMLRAELLSNTTVKISEFSTHIEDEHRTTVIRRYAYNVQGSWCKQIFFEIFHFYENCKRLVENPLFFCAR